MTQPKKKFEEKTLSIHRKFETVIAIGLSIIISILILVAFVRILVDLYARFFTDITDPGEIIFSDYQMIFGKIITLLISLEFMSSIINIIKSHSLRRLLEDVLLIAGLAISRKLIVYDYDSHEPMAFFSLGVLLLCIGIFYFLLRYQRKSTEA